MKASADSPRYHRGPLFYIKLWFSLFANTAHRSLEYRTNFFGRLLTEIIFLFSSVLFATSLAMPGQSVAGWSHDELLLFFGAMLMIDGAFMLFLHDNLHEFDTLIRQGTFDFHLLRPVSSLFLAAFRFPNVISAVNFTIAAGLVLYAILHLPQTPPAAAMLLGALYLGAGFLLVVALNVFIFSVAFFVVRSDMLVWVFFEFYRMSFRPDDFYFSWMRRLLFSLFPAAFFISVPVKIFLSKAISPWMWAGPWVCLLIAAIGVPFLWRQGIKRYEGALS